MTARVKRGRKASRQSAALVASVQAAVARRLAATRLDRRADLMLAANLPGVAERLSTEAAALREGGL